MLTDEEWSDETEEEADTRMRRGVAYHEAGHAVASWILGQRVRRVCIGGMSDRIRGAMTLEKDCYSGRAKVLLREMRKSCPDIRRAVEIIGLLAGATAQMQFDAKPVWPHIAYFAAHADNRETVKHLRAMTCTNEQRIARIELLNRVTFGFVFGHLTHIYALARALLANGRILKAKEIRQILGPRTMPLRRALQRVRQALEAADT